MAEDWLEGFGLHEATRLRTASSSDHNYFTASFVNGLDVQCWHWLRVPNATYDLEAWRESMLVDLSYLTRDEVTLLLGIVRRQDADGGL